MDSVKHLFRQISVGDYFLIALVVATVYFFVAANMENRQRLQFTALILFIVFCIRLIIGVSFTDSLIHLINKFQFIYIWAPLSLSVFFTSMFYERGNLKTILVRSVVASICVCMSLYFIFR